MRAGRRAAAAALGVLVLAAAAMLFSNLVRPDDDPEPAQPEPLPLRYAEEYPTIGYAEADVSGRVAVLEQRMAEGSLRLDGPEREVLLGVLAALDIDPASQMLVFSKTSQNQRDISPATPRAIYFNDEHYVAHVPGRPIEIASIDPDVGAVFFTLEPDTQAGSSAQPGGAVQRHTHRCLRCHDSYSLSGGGVPRLMIGSGYTSTAGWLVSHEGWILTTERTPLSSRWGGWYVTGYHGEQVHLGNIMVEDVAELADLEALRKGNLENLDGLFDASPYPTNTSDIVALMALAHQVNVQNLITRVHYDVETALAAGETSVDAVVAEAAEPLVRALLFDGEATLTDGIEGTSGFAAGFEARGPFDDRGRTLRELDLRERMFRYPLSYVVYSEAFAALPEPAKRYVYGRLAELLTGELPAEPIGHLADADRRAMLEILEATSPEFAAAVEPR